ncbi:hypothetical protein [Ornithinimicrobium pratense]|uniref:Uncharacterized protein n=1 Tax=Ornithinimicrobium pratense TaxID=2593973 RepID=A0A5J6V4Q4_9MICO|nr:hypothetical protein [Ornithinimicrobium pratense]QFG68274.1 hypothetical protein FY030_05680 [Ornithinimicrobium pratense]
MPWIRSRVAWGAGLLALFALLRALRRLVEADDRPLALVVAVGVIVVAGLVPPALGSAAARVASEQLAARKAVQFFGAAGVSILAVYLGLGVVVAAVLGIGAAVLVPLIWPAPAEGRRR